MAVEHASHRDCAVDVRDLSAGYNNHTALDGVTFTIERGCLAGLVGPNGCGKSTLLKVMLGLHKPWSGEVLIFGHSEHPTTATSATRRRPSSSTGRSRSP